MKVKTWKYKNLSSLTTKIGSGVTPRGGEKVYIKSGHPLVRSQNVGWGILLTKDIAHISSEIHNSMISTKLELGDVLLNISGASIGRSAVVDFSIEGGNVNQHVCIIRTIKEEANPYFINQFLISYYGQKQIESFQSGGNRQGLNIAQIHTFKVPTPPLPEQQKIAEILSKWDELIAEQTKLIATKETQKTGLMQKLLSGEVRFPGFEEEWREVKLGGIAVCKRGSSLSKKDIVDNGKNLCIHYGELFTTYAEVIDKIKSKTNISGFKSKSGDVLMPSSDVTPLGLAKASAILINDVILGGDINIIRLNKDNLGTFISYLLKYETNQILKYVSGTTVKHIYIKDIVQLKLKIPKNINEQKKIVEFLSNCSQEIQSLKEELESIKLQKKGLMQQLLTGKIRVKI